MQPARNPRFRKAFLNRLRSAENTSEPSEVGALHPCLQAMLS
jgi:hypothetical protein